MVIILAQATRSDHVQGKIRQIASSAAIEISIYE
jgi:hypothetical protein